MTTATAPAPEATKHELKVVAHAVCTFCGCVCDDIELHANEERIVETKRACILGEAWFKNHTAERLYPDNSQSQAISRLLEQRLAGIPFK